MNPPRDLDERRPYCTFRVGKLEFAFEASDVQEVLRECVWNAVPLAPPCVLGLMNLRGQIVTVVDLGLRLGLASSGNPEERASVQKLGIVLAGTRWPTSLAVDEVTDVVHWSPASLQAAPSTLGALARAGVRGVHVGEGGLVVVLDKQALLDWNAPEAPHGR